MNARRLFIAGCIALITSAFSFQVRQDISDPLGADFGLTKESVGAVMGAAFLGMAVSMVVVAPLCDFLGMGRVLLLAWICHLFGILGTIFAKDIMQISAVADVIPHLLFIFPDQFLSAPSSNTGFWVLWISTFLVGSGNGLVEVAINPLAATLFPEEKTHYLNILHAWWPGGLILSGLLILVVVNNVLGLKAPNVDAHTSSMGWKVKTAMVLIPLAIYGFLSLGQKFPVTERVQAKVTTGEMFLQIFRPMFILWAFCMLLTASTELGPNQWQESVLKRTANVSGTLVFVYTSGLMFIMRFFAGPLAHKLSPVGMLTGSAILSAVGLYCLSIADNPVMAFAAATVFGIGIAYFWPTMLGVTAERFPKGGALALGLMGSFGNLAVFLILPQMGAIYDSYTVKNIPSDLQAKVLVDKGVEVPVIQNNSDSWLPKVITDQIYPAGTKKLNPAARKLVEDAAQPDDAQATADMKEIVQAESEGARFAFRWVAVLPCILIFLFGAIAILDKLRGGYRAVHIGERS